MKKQLEADQQFSRLLDAVLVSVRSPSGNSLDSVITAAYDAIHLIDGKVTKKNIRRHHSTVLATAASLVAFGDSLKSNSYTPLRNSMTNLAVNLVMLVVESLAEYDLEASNQVFQTACDYARQLTDWNENLPPKERILGRLSFNEHKAPVKMLADVEATRNRIFTKLEEERKLLERIDQNLSHARFVLENAASAINSVRNLFEFDFGTEILRMRAETPYGITGARRWLAAGYKYIADIDAQRGDEKTVNRSKRAIVICQLAEAQIKSALAECYVAYWKGAKGLDSFGVLAHQAIAFGEACTDDNWTFFAPLAFIRPEEPLTQRSDQNMRMLIGYANAALAYAEALHAQMLTMPAAMRPPKFEPIKVAKPEVEETIEPASWPSINAYNRDREDVSQEEIASSHCSTTGDDLRENHWLGIGRRTRVYPKQRLVGFHGSRGGRNRKKSRKTQHAGA